MDRDHIARGMNPSQRADPMPLDPTSRPPEPASSPFPPLAPRPGLLDQMALNYSGSQAAASSTTNSHYRYRSRPTQGPNGEVLDSVTESGITTDDASFYSYHSARDLSAFVKEVDGRMFNNQSDLYVLPSDDGEFQRLDKQHYAFVLGQGGLYPCGDIVREILSTRDNGRQRSILDLGCGSGIWTIEMAREFPDCEVVGLDLAPAPVDVELLPPNCRFEIDDVNLGLSHYHGEFDVIHTRCIGSGLADHMKMMRDVEACLRPGGIVFFIDGDMTVYKEDMVTPIAVGEELDEGGDPNAGSWLHRIMREVRYAAVYNGCDVDGLENCIDQGMWDHELIDPSTVRVASLCTPVGAWQRSRNPDTQQRLAYVGSLIRQDFTRASRGWHPVLKKSGVPQETLDRWSERIDDELNSEKFFMNIRWRFTWGRRWKDDKNRVPAEPQAVPNPVTLSFDSPSVDRHHTTPGDFKFLDISYTQEQAAKVMALRREKVKDLPVPLVVRIRAPPCSSSSGSYCI